MKALQEFESWANNIYEAAVDTTPRTKEISRERDIVYQASKNYPDLTKDQALGLYLDDKLKQFDRRDMDQNAVINAQRKENAKLNANVSRLQNELDQIETTGRQTDSEIERLKSLSGRLSTDIQQRVVNKADVERALAQVEELKTKPGMNDEQYKKLKDELEAAKQNTSKINPEEFQNLSNQIKTLSGEKSLEKIQLDRLTDVTAKLTAQQQGVEAQKTDVMSKLAQLEKNQQELEQREKNLDKEIGNKVEAEVASKTEKIKKYRKAVQARSKQASTLIKNFLNNDLPRIDSLVTDEFPEKFRSIEDTLELVTGQIEDLIAKKSDTDVDEPATKPLPSPVSAQPTPKQLPSPDVAAAAELTARTLNKYGKFGLNPETLVDLEKEKEEIKEEEQLSLFSPPATTQTVDPYQIWKETGITRPLAEKYVKTIMAINRLIRSPDSPDRERAAAILYLVKEVTKKLTSQISALQSDKKYENFAEVIDGLIIYLVYGSVVNYETASINTYWVTSSSYPKIIYKRLVRELNHLVDSLEYLRQRQSVTPKSLDTRGPPTKDFKKLHDEPIAPEEPSTLPPQEMFRESIDNMINSIVGEQVSKWIK